MERSGVVSDRSVLRPHRHRNRTCVFPLVSRSPQQAVTESRNDGASGLHRLQLRAHPVQERSRVSVPRRVHVRLTQTCTHVIFEL